MVTKIEGLGNCYGSLHIKKKLGKYYTKVFCEVSNKEWIEINKELYEMLLKLNYNKEIDAAVERVEKGEVLSNEEAFKELDKVWGNDEDGKYKELELTHSQKWINVNDRLPHKDNESSIYCLVWNDYHKGMEVRPFNEYHKTWDTTDGDDYYTDSVNGKISHWQPLPEEPTS